MTTLAEKYWMDRVAQTGCIICRRIGRGWVPGHVHHIAPGSAPRSNFSVVCLCVDHHVGPAGFHHQPLLFIKVHRVPFELELGLLIWQAEDLALLALGRLPLAVA